MAPTNITKFTINNNNLILELLSPKIDIEEVNLIISQYRNLKNSDVKAVVLKPLICTTITSAARDILAKFFQTTQLNSIAFVAQNRYQVTTGSLLMSLCNKKLSSRVCFSISDAIEWNKQCA